MITSSHTCGATATDHLSFCDDVALLNAELAHVSIEAL